VDDAAIFVAHNNSIEASLHLENLSYSEVAKKMKNQS